MHIFVAGVDRILEKIEVVQALVGERRSMMLSSHEREKNEGRFWMEEEVISSNIFFLPGRARGMVTKTVRRILRTVPAPAAAAIGFGLSAG